MPSRKSDQRKSDVTAARFALAEDDVDYPKSGSAGDAETSNEARDEPSKKRQSLGSGQGKKPKQKDSEKEKPSNGDLEKGKDADEDDGTGKERDGEKGKDREAKDAVTVEDLTLPKSIITRLAKGVLPPNTQIQANAVLAISKSTIVFINYLAAHANEHTMNAGKKTIAPADVFKALDDIEFPFLKDRLEAEFAKFNSIQTAKRTNYRQKVRASKQSPDESTQLADTDMADADLDADITTATNASATASRAGKSEGPPKAKKARVDSTGKKGGSMAEAGDGEATETDEEQDAEDQDDVVDDEDDDEDGDEEEEEDDEADAGSGDETQDALEVSGEERDEALDEDDSD